MRYIISTIGTSILTNSINRVTEGNWFGILGASANLKEYELSEESKDVIDELAERAHGKLKGSHVGTHRSASAELNGIYGIYEGTLPEQNADQHYLICTDTYQGQTTGNLIKDFLEKRGFNASVVIPKKLSTKDTDAFTDGIKELIQWLENSVSGQRDSGHQVIFNLVGGFKSLQGYMQTFGAFYADESVYIFEGSSELIRIPRLPIQIDTTEIQQYRKQFSMMAAKAPCLMTEVTEVENISKTLLDIIEDKGKSYVGLSAWGMLIWNRTKDGLLEAETEMIKEHGIQFALLDAGESLEKLFLRWDREPKRRPDLHIVCTNINESLLEFSEKNGKTYVEMSTWGKLVWDHAKSDVLGRTLPLDFPRLRYRDTFLSDIRRHGNRWLDLQETLAKISVALQNSGGDTSPNSLNEELGRGMNFEELRRHNGICTFRISRGFRVSYEVNNGNLILRRYDTEPNVNRNP